MVIEISGFVAGLLLTASLFFAAYRISAKRALRAIRKD